jgi:hypothetical protein
LVVVVTLVSAYFGCWEATKRQGVEDVYRYSRRHGPIEFLSARVPFVVTDGRHLWFRENYFWFFGYVTNLTLDDSIDESRLSLP